MLDGVHRRGTDDSPEFVELPAPTDEALQAVLHKIITRMMKLLTRRGCSSKSSVKRTWPTTTAIRTRPARSGLSGGGVYLPHRLRSACGQMVSTLQGAMPRQTRFDQTLCADMQGFSLHAAARCGSDERQGLDQLCRYINRPALANERTQTNTAGQVVLKLKTRWRDAPRTW